jgi:glycosyltransferase involved in cell wall biosynthesis
MVKIFYPLRRESPALPRIRWGLLKYAPPEVELTSSPEKAELQILDWTGDIVKPACSKYVLLVHNPPIHRNQEFLREVFQKAELCITYTKYYTFRNEYCPSPLELEKFRWLVTPWGVDLDMFYINSLIRERPHLIMCTGTVAETELHREIYEAVRRVGGKMVHVGSDVGIKGEGYTLISMWIPDYEMNLLYNMSRYVSAIRKPWGFELPGIEGLACGCTPIWLNHPIHREWFEGYGLFIDTNRVTEELIEIFKSEKKVNVSREKLEKFNWKNIAERIWREILE